MFHVARLAVAASVLAILALAMHARGDQGVGRSDITIVGIVKVASPDDEAAATVIADKVLYRIVKDDKGKIVARDAAGKKVEIRGTVRERNGQRWITVNWCALVE